MGSGIGSQLRQKSPPWRIIESDHNAMPDFKSGASLRIPEGKEATEKADEELNGKRKPVPKSELKHSLMHNG